MGIDRARIKCRHAPDLNEAIAFATNGLVKASIRTIKLDQINDTLDEMRKGKIVGRVVIDMTA